MKLSRFVIIVGLLTSPFAHSEEYTGRLFDVGKTEGSPLYLQKVKVEQSSDGTTTTSGTMTDASGKLLIREHAVYSGATFISQEIENYLDKKEYRATLKDKRVYFETYSLEQEKKLLSSRHERISGTLVTGPLTENFLRDNWETLMKGKRVDCRFASFERMETFGFSFKKKSEGDVDGKPAVVFVMRPTSFFVSMVVAPMEVSVDKESKTIIHFKGRTPIKDSKDKNLQADIIYDRRVPSISRNTASVKKDQ